MLQTHGKAKYPRRWETKDRTKTMKMGLKSVYKSFRPLPVLTFPPPTSNPFSYPIYICGENGQEATETKLPGTPVEV